MHLNQFFLEWSTFLAVIDLQDIIETDLLLRLQYCLIWKITKPPPAYDFSVITVLAWITRHLNQMYLNWAS